MDLSPYSKEMCICQDQQDRGREQCDKQTYDKRNSITQPGMVVMLIQLYVGNLLKFKIFLLSLVESLINGNFESAQQSCNDIADRPKNVPVSIFGKVSEAQSSPSLNVSIIEIKSESCGITLD